MTKERKYYWRAQLTAWTAWSLLPSLYSYWTDIFSPGAILLLFLLIALLGIVVSHLLRQFMIAAHWLKLPLIKLLPRALIGTLLAGVIYTLLMASILDLFLPGIDRILSAPYDTLFQLFISNVLICMLWSAAYLVYNYVRNYERQELKNLKLEASKNQMELNVLRSQLNPHFIFNAMTSIRALVNEDPELAKTAISKLSNILRGSLMAGRKQSVTLKEELAIVMDLLSLEKIRYEERLDVRTDIDESSLHWQIPPLIIQTLVENAIKHGISTLTDGGLLHIKSSSTQHQLTIDIENSGHYDSDKAVDLGIGLDNTQKRLAIIYGGSASLTIENTPEAMVRARLILPQLKIQLA